MSERGWDAITFEGVQRAQLRDQVRLAPSERLRWLEEALRFAAARGDAIRRHVEHRVEKGEPSRREPSNPRSGRGRSAR